ncbi:MAG TPA: hypothetical protein VI300_30415 [Solirubrobacter sp.]
MEGTERGATDRPVLRSLRRQKALLLADVNTIRETNNAIFDDIFWAHLAYGTADDGIECLRGLLRTEPHYAAMLSGFEAIDQGRRLLENTSTSAETRRRAADLIWRGNVQLLEHEQQALVQPNLDRLSCAFARLFSIGSVVTSIVPRFQRFDADTRLADASLGRIFDEARDYASNPCVLRRPEG